MEEVDMRELLALSIAAAEEGGKMVKLVRKLGDLLQQVKEKTKEDTEELLTMGDLASHRVMTSLFKTSFPNVKVISEEDHDTEGGSLKMWSFAIPEEVLQYMPRKIMVPAQSLTVWIDPLDATQEYIEYLTHFTTTMVCVAVNGKPIIGVIHKPFNKLTVWAMVNGGANVKRRRSYREETPTIIVSQFHAGIVKNFSRKAFGENTPIIVAGGAGYKVLSLLDLEKEVQTDLADVYVHVTYIKKWDICAGNAILEALGGHMTTLKGDDIDYQGSPANRGGLMASIGLDHKRLIEKLPDLSEP
uniref:3'(2'), 5'-bisphosphate nucleotidase 2 n=2 Tax=Latimeria chalumnae TaxID=7897 RepID=H3AKE9_LATCH|nr:PREDICTED: inositol monophosphatase 3-like [Latimeria chalumnae]|eukprot:XP_006008806.1 PREDICTED: inositol monophosphatase 3-like [Latimeria chalumnae]